MNQQLAAQTPETKKPPASHGILQRRCACGKPITANGECAACNKKRQKLQRKAINPNESQMSEGANASRLQPKQFANRKPRRRDRSTHGDELSQLPSGRLSRQAAPPQPQNNVPAAPQYRDCTPAITGQADPNRVLEAARGRAREFVGAASRALNQAPTAGTTYATALNRHFVLSPPAGLLGGAANAAARIGLQTVYQRIQGALVRNNFICNTGRICNRTEQAFWIPDDDLIHVCPRFWGQGRTCQAIILVHEAAHDVGIDAAPGGHAPNRGSGNYPTGNNPPPAGQNFVARQNNPDAYAFFAAHIWRDTDTGRSCF